jgi:hypothetical protein
MKLISVVFFALLFFQSLETPSGKKNGLVTNDTLRIQPRSFDQLQVKEFKADDAFHYGRTTQTGITFWQRFWIWVARIISSFLELLQTTVGKIIFYSTCIGLLLYIILKVLDIDARDLFYRSSAKSRINFSLAEENIHALDFEKLIQEAVGKRQFRDAVRLVFLFSLQKLSDEKLIQWMPGKTNDDYLRELKQHPVLPYLKDLRYYFDYAWYGHFEINDQTFEDVRQKFHDFKTRLVEA